MENSNYSIFLVWVVLEAEDWCCYAVGIVAYQYSPVRIDINYVAEASYSDYERRTVVAGYLE